jgi:outer membrane protein TolC
MMSGCISEKVSTHSVISNYQESLAAGGPQGRTGIEGLEPISPTPDPRLPGLKETKGTTGKMTINLSLENAVVRVLANSPEIKIVSYDPSIAKERLTVAASEFDVTAFGQLGYDDTDSPSNDISVTGLSHSSLWEAGIRQKWITGAEWSVTSSLTRTVDDSISRIFSTSYEPAVTFELKQPLLRDAWPDINLAGVDISKLNYRAALAAFREKAEDVSTEVISLYWTLLQARRDVEIQQALLENTIETLRKVEDRKDIDATVGDIKQAESSVKSRHAVLLDLKKRLSDVQGRLVRLLADHQMNLISEFEIVPTTVPDTVAVKLDQSELLKLALHNNQKILQAQLEVEVVEIDVMVAKREEMPRLDLVVSTQLQGLSDDQGDALEMIGDRNYSSYAVGVMFEYPLGNREKKAQFNLRKLQHTKAISKLHNVTDLVATLVKESIRLAETAHKEIQVHKETVEAARIHLQSLKDVETVRRKLTPEFLLAKIQAQDSLAKAQRAEIKAIADYNIALARIARDTGTVLDLRSVQSALPKITGRDQLEEDSAGEGTETGALIPN